LAHEAFKKLKLFDDQGLGEVVLYSALADLYESGRGVPGGKHRETAAIYYTKAADLGDDEAQLWLAKLFWVGDKELGYIKNVDEGLKLYNLAADRGNTEALAFLTQQSQSNTHITLSLGLRYEMGNGVTADDVKAMQFYQRAGNHAKPVLEALYRLAGLKEKYEKPLEAAELYAKLIRLKIKSDFVQMSLTKLDELCVLYNTNSVVFNTRGLLKEESRNFHEALIDFDQSINISTPPIDVLYARGNCLEELNMKDEAFTFYRELLGNIHAANRAVERLQHFAKGGDEKSRYVLVQYEAQQVFQKVGIAVSLEAAIPDMVKGKEDLYIRFIKGNLIYVPDCWNDVGKVVMPIAALSNPLDGTFDLSQCGIDAPNKIKVMTGFKNEVQSSDGVKEEFWIVPKFVLESEGVTPPTQEWQALLRSSVNWVDLIITKENSMIPLRLSSPAFPLYQRDTGKLFPQPCQRCRVVKSQYGQHCNPHSWSVRQQWHEGGERAVYETITVQFS
jgi:tetratricopeptide (TPR) repeat protein